MLAEMGLTISRIAGWRWRVVSDGIAKKKAFICGSPLTRQKKGLGEGKLRALICRAQRRIVDVVIVDS